MSKNKTKQLTDNKYYENVAAAAGGAGSVCNMRAMT